MMGHRQGSRPAQVRKVLRTWVQVSVQVAMLGGGTAGQATGTTDWIVVNSPA